MEFSACVFYRISWEGNSLSSSVLYNNVVNQLGTPLSIIDWCIHSDVRWRDFKKRHSSVTDRPILFQKGYATVYIF